MEPFGVDFQMLSVLSVTQYFSGNIANCPIWRADQSDLQRKVAVPNCFGTGAQENASEYDDRHNCGERFGLN